MAHVSPLGSIQFTVELSGAAVVFRSGRTATPRSENLRRLRQMFREQGLTVTWCIASHDDEAIGFVGSDPTMGDVALLVDEKLLPGASTRHRFEEVIHTALSRFGGQRQVAHVMTNISTPELHTDVLRDAGIRGVLGVAVGGRVSRIDARPRQLRHELTRIPCAAAFPDRSGWWGRWDGAFRAKSVLVRAWQQRTSEQIVIRESTLSAMGPTAWKSLRRLLRTTQRTIAQERLRCETMTEVCNRLGAQPTPPAQRSILRAA